MILSQNTIKTLQNFATINPNIVVEKDSSVLKTVSEAKNIMAQAETEDIFDEGFGIFDLNEFLSAVSIIPSPTFTFGSEYINIESTTTKASIKYFCANPSILTYPKSTINDPEYEVSLTLTTENLASIKKAASVLSHDRFSFVKEADSHDVFVQVSDVSNKSSNAYREAVGLVEDDSSFSFNFLISNLKLLPGQYNIELSSKFISKWSIVPDNTKPDIVYWLAIETSSNYNS